VPSRIGTLTLFVLDTAHGPRFPFGGHLSGAEAVEQAPNNSQAPSTIAMARTAVLRTAAPFRGPTL
jgi:hypothetical protein